MKHHVKYPKLILLVISLIFAYLIFAREDIFPVHSFFLDLGYVGLILAGMLYAYGFTAAPATAILFVLSKNHNLMTAAYFATIGALISDMIIFTIIRLGVKDEIDMIKHSRSLKAIDKIEKKLFGHFKRYFLAVFAGFLIASPLPTEAGVAMIASMKKMSVWKFALLAVLLHGIGIFVILYLGRII